MAVVFTKNYLETDILSTGNHWILKYSSDVAEFPIYSRVAFLGETFNLDPDPSGNFSFDFKTSISDKVNASNFNDPHNDVDISGGTYVYNDGEGYLRIFVSISIFFNASQTNVYTQEYRFKTSVYDEEVYQLGHKSIDVKSDVLLPYVGDKYYLQGTSTQPLDFSFYSYEADVLVLFNATTSTTVNVPLSEGVNRVFLQDGRGNSLTGLTMVDGINELQMLATDTNELYDLQVTIKGSSCCSVLKWFNLEGGFGYHVFQHKTEDYSSKTKGFIENDYNTFDEYDSNLVSTGADMISLLGFTSIRVDENQMTALEGLIASPKVYQLLTKSDGSPLWKERVFKQGEMRIKQTGKRVFDFEIETFKTKKGFTL